MRDRRGMTLIEMIVALTVFSIVMVGALGFLSKQSKGLDKNSSDMGMLQNLSFAGTLLEQEIRLAGANVPWKQPGVIYAGANSFIFSADYASDIDSLYAVYYNPGLPSGQVNALTAADRFALPGTSPSYMYPDSSYYAQGSTIINSPAETIAWFFQLDTSTPATNDYVLLRQVNDAAPETVIRNVIQTPGRSFFKYYYKRIPTAGTVQATLDSVPASWMPIVHTQAIHGATTDTGNVARIDNLGTIEIAFTVTNGLTGTSLRSRAISFMVPMPNLGVKKVTSCGDAPLLGTSLAAAWQINTATSPPDTNIMLTWSRATDETGGERDVRAYVIWRRDIGATIWDEPIATVSAGPTSPSYADDTAIPGAPGYEYGLAAQDCTPSLSTMVTVNAPLSPP